MMLGLILSGGQSQRMGKDKNLLQINGEGMLLRTYNLLQKTPLQNILLANKTGDPPQINDLKSIADTHQLSGPCAGIFAGLEWAQKNNIQWVQLCPIDMPLLTPNIFTVLSSFCNEETGAIVPKSQSGIEPLLALIQTEKALIILKHVIEMNIARQEKIDDKEKNKGVSVNWLLHELGCLQVGMDVFNNNNIEDSCFWNMNYPIDYQKIVDYIN
jgi:molybdopterin-guanine dinucleotide biosynthesis protein A